MASALFSPQVQASLPGASSVVPLLLSCARTRVSPSVATYIQEQLQAGPDWQQLLGLARRHGLLPLLYQHLQTLAPQGVPPEILGALRHHAQSTALQSAMYTKELLSMCQLLEAHDIRVLPFKGPVLAIAVYGNLGLRHFGDLDVWVHPQDSAAAIALLTHQADFVVKRKWHYLSPTLEQRYQRAWGECCLLKGTLPIDFHQRLTVETFLSRSFTFDQIWERRASVQISGYAVPSFCPEDRLLYLSLHGAKECWRSLKWICDVAECVQAYSWDWQAVLALAQQRGCQRRLHMGLSLAHQLLGTEIPEPVQQSLAADPRCQQLTQTMLTALFQQDAPFGQQFSWQKFRYHVQSVERPQDKVRSLNELRRLVRTFTMQIFPNNYDQEALPLPVSLQWLHYILRPFRLLGQALKP